MVSVNCLEFKDICFYYKEDNLILDYLNAKFVGGKIIALLGINGCGKTTLFKILTGVYRPKNGTLSYNGAVIDSHNILEYKSTIGYMPEFLQMYNNMYIRDVLKLLADLKGYKFIDIDEVLLMVSLSQHSHKKVKALSKGMKQKLNLAQAIVGNPKVILFDEPSNGFDCGSIDVFYNILRKIASTGAIVLISSHHLVEIYGNVDNVVILSKGKIIKEVDINCMDYNDNFTYKEILIFIDGYFDDDFLLYLRKNCINVSIKRNNVLSGRVNNKIFIGLLLEIIRRNFTIRDIRLEDKILEEMLLDLS
ncbi:MAG TPA: ABC transporter ATP-binding protein [Candidatus Azoamicus sp. OHIO1]